CRYGNQEQLPPQQTASAEESVAMFRSALDFRGWRSREKGFRLGGLTAAAVATSFRPQRKSAA
ncbi:MAG: hypothetical protein ACUVQQ_15325, partial [Thermogutta sp.]